MDGTPFTGEDFMVNNRRHAVPSLIAGALLLALISVAMLGSTSAATFAEKLQKAPTRSSHSQVMTYDVYAGGIHAVQAKLEVGYQKNDRYDLRIDAQTIGFLKKLAPWSGTFETIGKRQQNGGRPEIHRSTALWRDENEMKEYSYDAQGSLRAVRVIEEGQDKPQEVLDPALVKDTTDILSATLAVMESVAQGGECQGAADIYDGARRFELAFRHADREEMKATDYNVYSGPAVRCEVEVTPEGGAWHKKPRGWMSIQEQGRLKGSLPTVWMAQLDKDGPAVPVKIRVKTDYGTLFMHLTSYQSGDALMKASAE